MPYCEQALDVIQFITMKRRHPSESNLIIVFIILQHQAMREKLSGIYSAAVRLGWQIMPLEERFSASRWREITRLWRPIGCIIDTSAMPGDPPGSERLTKRMLFGFPAVILGRDMTRRHQVFDCSTQNAYAPVDVALRKFRELGLEHIGFLGHPDSPLWSVERGQHLQDAVRPHRCWVYSGTAPHTEKGFAELVDWLLQLPMPTGILLATDHLAPLFYTAARIAGHTIGTDLVVIGVDNIEQICNSLAPTLTSVHLDFFKAGENAIALLRQRIDHSDLPVQIQTYGVIELASRSSTARCYPDPRVNAGLSFILDRKCDRISASDVAATMKCGRRMAEKLFAKYVRRTICETIRLERLKKAKALLQDSRYPIDDIPGLCGYDSLSHMKTYFRQETGQTMRDWRRSHLKCAALQLCRKYGPSSCRQSVKPETRSTLCVQQVSTDLSLP